MATVDLDDKFSGTIVKNNGNKTSGVFKLVENDEGIRFFREESAGQNIHIPFQSVSEIIFGGITTPVSSITVDNSTKLDGNTLSEVIPSASDGGSIVVEDVTDFNAGTNISIKDDGDSTVIITTDEEINLDDDSELILGADQDFKLRYDSANDRFELEDDSGNVSYIDKGKAKNLAFGTNDIDISGQTNISPADDDKVLVSDTSDSNNIKEANVSDIGGGGIWTKDGNSPFSGTGSSSYKFSLSKNNADRYLISVRIGESDTSDTIVCQVNGDNNDIYRYYKYDFSTEISGFSGWNILKTSDTNSSDQWYSFHNFKIFPPEGTSVGFKYSSVNFHNIINPGNVARKGRKQQNDNITDLNSISFVNGSDSSNFDIPSCEVWYRSEQ